jgi:hypothetical protein
VEFIDSEVLGKSRRSKKDEVEAEVEAKDGDCKQTSKQLGVTSHSILLVSFRHAPRGMHGSPEPWWTYG